MDYEQATRDNITYNTEKKATISATKIRLMNERIRIDTQPTSSSTSSDNRDIAPESAEDSMEPWHELVRRATHCIEHVSSKCNIDDWVAQARKKCCSWAGHVARRHDERWSTEVLN